MKTDLILIIPRPLTYMNIIYSVALKCLPDPSRYAGWLSYVPSEYDWPFYCAEGYEWSDGGSQWKKVMCDANTNGSRVFYYDMNNKLEVSCDRIFWTINYFS